MSPEHFPRTTPSYALFSPYDTGDRVLIDSEFLAKRHSYLPCFLTHSLEENLIVKKVGLFATVFSRADGTESYYFNSQLFSKFMSVIIHLGSILRADGCFP